MRTEAQMATIVTRSTKEHQLEMAKRWGIPPSVVARSTLGLAVTMLHESGCTEDQIVELVRTLVAELADDRGFL